MATFVPLDDIRTKGYLLEVNRQFFHPLGLALALVLEDGKPKRLELLQTDDPEGWIMGSWTQEDLDHAFAVRQEMYRRLEIRLHALGFGIEPVPGVPTPE